MARGGGPREQQARPAPCVTGSVSSPDEQTSAPSFAQRLTAGLGAVAPGIGVTASGCTAVTAVDSPDRRLPPPETPPAPQRSVVTGAVHLKPERSRGGADDSASLAEALRTAARRRLLPGAEHVLIKAPGLEPLQPPPPGALQNLHGSDGRVDSLWTNRDFPVSQKLDFMTFLRPGGDAYCTFGVPKCDVFSKLRYGLDMLINV